MTEDEIRAKARQILLDNNVRGYSKSTGIYFHYTKPSQKPYASQYFWDSCFHSFIWTALGEHDMAKAHLESLFALQEKEGFVGHIIYWNQVWPNRITDIFQSRPTLKKMFSTHSSALLEPPFIAQAVGNIYNNDKDIYFLREMYPKLKRYYGWLAKYRDFEGDGVLSIISPFESGMDWKPTFDEVVGFRRRKANWKLFWRVVYVDFRNFIYNYNLKKIYHKNYFIVKEVGYNTVYVHNLQTMAALAKIMQDPDASYYQSQADKVLKNMVKIMFDEQDEAFYDVYGKDNKKIRVLTPTIFFPVVIQGLPDELCRRILQRHLFNKDEFEVSYPIPSVAINDPSFKQDGSLYLWRGPTWIFFNWFIYQYLKDKKYDKEANMMIDCIRSVIEKSGFREYYNPFTGEGYGAVDFTWTGLIVDMINKEKEKGK
jgi:glycogen debranching enzyme